MVDVAERQDYSDIVHDSSANDADAVTPSDTNKLRKHTRGIYVGVTGDLTVHFLRGGASTFVTFVAVPAGAMLPIRVDMVRATNTTATSIVALF